MPKHTDPASHGYHIDRRIPVIPMISLGLFLVAQTVTGTWWLAQADNAIGNNTAKHDILERRVTELQRKERVSNDVLINLSNNLKHQTQALEKFIEEQKRRDERLYNRRLYTPYNGSATHPRTNE